MGDISTACRLSEEPHMDVIRASKTHGDNLRRRTLSGFALRHNNGQTDSYRRTHWHARPQVPYHQREHSVRANKGFDSQGDNVFLTRESVFLSFCEYYTERWHRQPHRDAVLKAAEIISWNIWQMDGLNFNVPNSDRDAVIMEWHNAEPLDGKRIAYKDIVK